MIYKTLRDVIERFLQDKYNDTSIVVLEYQYTISTERFAVRTYNLEEWESKYVTMEFGVDTRQQICYEFSKKQFERFERKEKIKSIFQ